MHLLSMKDHNFRSGTQMKSSYQGWPRLLGALPYHRRIRDFKKSYQSKNIGKFWKTYFGGKLGKLCDF